MEEYVKKRHLDAVAGDVITHQSDIIRLIDEINDNLVKYMFDGIPQPLSSGETYIKVFSEYERDHGAMMVGILTIIQFYVAVFNIENPVREWMSHIYGEFAFVRHYTSEAIEEYNGYVEQYNWPLWLK